MPNSDVPLIGFLKAALPPSVRTFLKKGRRYWQRRRSPRSVFAHIYAHNVWGGPASELFSGTGSRGSVASRYVECVRSLIEAHRISTVVDLGCGDFHIGNQIAKSCGSYVGIDIVPMVVDRLAGKYSSDRVRFACLDIIADPLPCAQLCLIRQVLQHLSNAQILKVLRNVSRYERVIITEHYPPEEKVIARNLDKRAGADTRLPAGSAVYLSDPPFCLSNLELLLEVELPRACSDAVPVYETGSIRSYLWRP